MDAFTTVRSVAALLLEPGIDTDAIIPAQCLRSPSFDLGQGLFLHRRFDDAGLERPDFVLNRPPFRSSRILVAGDNFGCGSSREHAVWALLRFGIRCVIATSFGEIFYENCFKNGLLAIVLPGGDFAALADRLSRSAAEIEVDLRSCTIAGGDFALTFAIDAGKRRSLLDGADEIAATIAHIAEIRSFRERDRLARPWIYPAAAGF
jgi:3-isopropylmalate/(R)-2-methylmalate dehydratase small subunit